MSERKKKGGVEKKLEERKKNRLKERKMLQTEPQVTSVISGENFPRRLFWACVNIDRFKSAFLARPGRAKR